MKSDVKTRGIWLQLTFFVVCFAVMAGAVIPGNGYGLCLCTVSALADNYVSGGGKSDRLNTSLGKEEPGDSAVDGAGAQIDRALALGSKDNERSRELSDLQNASRFKGAIASVHKEAGSLMVTYVDGWHEQIASSHYTLTDPENNIVVRRPVRQEDVMRLDEVMRRMPR